MASASAVRQRALWRIRCAFTTECLLRALENDGEVGRVSRPFGSQSILFVGTAFRTWARLRPHPREIKGAASTFDVHPLDFDVAGRQRFVGGSGSKATGPHRR